MHWPVSVVTMHVPVGVYCHYVRTESVMYIATMYVRKVSCTLPLCTYGKCRVYCHYAHYAHAGRCILPLCTYGKCRLYCHYVRTESVVHIATMYVRKVSCILPLYTYGKCRVYCHYTHQKTTTRNLLKQNASSHSCFRSFSFFHSQLSQRLTHVGNSSKKSALEI